MALARKSASQSQPTRRVWKKPRARAGWLWLACSALIYGAISIWYVMALKTQHYPGPSIDPFRIFGIVAYLLVLLVAAYSLRRRFVRVLPGRVDSWLWLHTWLGIASILVAFDHEIYQNILNDFQFTLSRFVEAGAGMSALYALLLLVISGIIGRLLDTWQARVIAVEARRNGVGIVQAVKERLHEQELLIERLSAGKSADFKQYCTQAMRSSRAPSASLPRLTPNEQREFQHAYEVLVSRVNLTRSLKRQQRAHFIIRLWRYVHIPLACLALGIISLHSLLELTKMLLQLFRHGAGA